MPSTTGFTNSRWLGFGETVTAIVSPVSARCVPVAPRWYFTSPEPWYELGSLPSNSAKICEIGLPTVLASTFSRPRCDIPITTSRRPRSAASFRIRSSSGIKRLAALEREALVADVLGVQEALEGLGLDHLLEHPLLARRVERRVVARRLHAMLQPLLALGVGDVHVLDADRAAVGLAQDVEDLAQGGAVLAGEPAGHELAVEVPEREPVGRRVEVAVRRPMAVERVEVGHQVPAHAVVVDQLQHLRLLLDLLATARRAEEARVRVHLPAHRPVRHAEVA